MKRILEHKSCVLCPDRCIHFDMLKKKELELIDMSKVSVSFSKGEIICKNGTFADYVMLLVEGQARIYIEGANNKNIMLQIIKPYEFIGLAEMMCDTIYRFSASAVSNSRVCFIEVKAFHKLAQSNIAFASKMIGYFGKSNCNLLEKISNITQKQLRGRLADTLIYLSDEIYNSHKFKLTITRKDLAELSSMSPENAIRILREFRNENIVDINESLLEILDMDFLKKISEIG